MLEAISIIYLNLTAIGFYPLITVAALAMYFVSVQIFGHTKRRSLLVVWAISALGQVVFSEPKMETLARDLISVLFYSLMQGSLAIGLYSWGDKYNIPDKLGTILTSRRK